MAAGEEGVLRVASLRTAQFTRTRQLLGVRSVAELRELAPQLPHRPTTAAAR
jgi:hypothetical protein